MIASTKHSYKKLNMHKKTMLLQFVEEYSRVCREIVDVIWDSLPDTLEVSKYQNYKTFNVTSKLSARALQCAANQAAGIVRCAVEKQRRRIWIRENINKDIILDKNKFSKPCLDFVPPQLNANCCNFKIERKHFEGFIKLYCLGSEFKNIYIPIDQTSQFKKWILAGAKLCGSITLFKTGFQLAFDLKRNPVSQGDKELGVDQGYKTVATLSDGQTTPECCQHKHTLQSILQKLARKKRGSKSFKKAQAHRKNFVHWSINQLNFKGFKAVKLEKIVNIRYKKRCSRVMSHWNNPEIRDKIKRRCEELEVPIEEQSCVYRSQRCCQCGLVRKANRKGKIYKCNGCENTMDADLNAAKNHEIDLFPVPNALIVKRLNLGKGFFWKSNGFFDVFGSEIIVPNNQIKIFK